MSEEVYDPWLLGIQKVLKSFLGLVENKARYVTVRFDTQKNREKCDVRTEKHRGLCPMSSATSGEGCDLMSWVQPFGVREHTYLPVQWFPNNFVIHQETLEKDL
jgi:hypothetical protein